MDKAPRTPNREEQARREAGRTAVRPATARVLAGFFLTVMCILPLVQQAAEVRAYIAGGRTSPVPQAFDIVRVVADGLRFIPEAGWSLSGVFAANRRLLRGIREYETALDEAAVVSRWVRPHIQRFLSGFPGVGNEKAYVGAGSWLFYRPGVDYVSGPGFLDPHRLARRAAGGSEWEAAPRPDPVPAIVDFRDRLRERGIALLVFPVPDKASLHPEKLAGGPPAVRPLQNPSYDRFREVLSAQGVEVLDPAEAMLAWKRRTNAPLFLETDTHWRPETVAVAAETLAARLSALLPSGPSPGYRVREVAVRNPGDLAVMLQLPAGQTRFPPETAILRQVCHPDGSLWRPDPAADVLLLGDSFTNIYSLAPMGWGEGAGFAEALSYALGRPVDRISRNDNGAFATREALAQEMARGQDRLAGKRVVVWQFAARELASGDWKPVALAPAAPVRRFLALPAGGEMGVRGVVRSVSVVPKPGTVPYKDHVMAIHLADIVSSDGGPVPAREALVYAQSMADNVPTEAARLRPGQMVDMRILSWQDVAGRYEGMNRSELDDEALQFVEPCWGEPLRRPR